MLRISAPFFLLVVILAIACNQSKNGVTNNDGEPTFMADSFKQHISVLASDSFMGRKPFTKGETLTVDYLQNQFKALGLEPGNGKSYLQKVPMVNILATAAPTMQVQSPKGNFTLKAFDDYIIWTDKTDPNISLDNSELIFAGYGVVAPEYNWNDYAGLDVKGKVVLAMRYEPHDEKGSSRFSPDG